jgi:hypothetical protein
MFTCDVFLSVAKFDSRNHWSMSGYCRAIHWQAACVALPVRFWPAASAGRVLLDVLQLP